MKTAVPLPPSLNVDKRVETESETASPKQLQPSVETVIEAICLDARTDALKFLLRSNTGHDGE